ncbi:electron transport complex subunit RsxC [Dechloromonas denitrificans]|uniref:electron transport complex subunit RsxC n=1 Tax=Dechloromonas denitrificans TaxID=281362 RepID=UPI001CFB143B|nr:electron transport complex subunit RsxC [Dechloromonas denitrificans]UCV09441.1 electron transport complex subunit RsxC [Dechloromonas denitrificans]
MGFLDRFLKTPNWGVHPEDHKRPAADAPLRLFPSPPRVFMPLHQHVGGAARPVVLVGQKVLKGQLIAEAQGNISAPIHASVSGTISAVGEVTAPHPSGLPFKAITIDSDGADRWFDSEPLADPFSAAPEEIARRAALAGVVGLGGATFPAAVKFALGKRLKVSTLIVNGGECEPYLSSDDRIMRDFPEMVIDGARLVMHAIGATDALVGIEDNKPEAIAAMLRAAAAYPEVKIRPVPAWYPMGSDKQLIQTLTGKEVPSDARAAEVGVLVHNVSTCAAVHKAIRLGQPLVERIITLNGGAIANPGNLYAPLGTMISDLFAFVGLREAPARLILGGPMMGTPLLHDRIPIVKGASGILAFNAAEAFVPEAGPCIRCGSCTKACPMGLLPLEMAARIRVGDLEGAEAYALQDCISCGCCAYVCPSHIPLVQYFSHAKGELTAAERTKLRTEATRRLAEAKTARIERENREKAEAAARRKAEREAAKAATAAAPVTEQTQGASA